MQNCKACKNATVLFTVEKDGRYSNSYAPSGFASCAGPRYNGRAYIIRDNKMACAEFEPRERKA